MFTQNLVDEQKQNEQPSFLDAVKQLHVTSQEVQRFQPDVEHDRTTPSDRPLKKQSASAVRDHHVNEMMEVVDGRLNTRQLRAILAMHHHDPSKFTPDALGQRVGVEKELIAALFQYVQLPGAFLQQPQKSQLLH